MSIDAKIRSVEPRADGGFTLNLEPRWDRRVRRFSIEGQPVLQILPPVTWVPEPGLAIWGGSGTIIVVERDGSERWYERLSLYGLRERGDGSFARASGGIPSLTE